VCAPRAAPAALMMLLTLLSPLLAGTSNGPYPSPPCPRGPWLQSGRLPVTLCNATNDAQQDTLPAFQACAQLAAACGAVLTVPPGKYWLNGSLHLSKTTLSSRDGSLQVTGASSSHTQLCRCHGCIDSRCEGSPTILVGDPAPASAAGYEGTDGVKLTNLHISGSTIAVRVINGAGIRMQDVRLTAGKSGSSENVSTAALVVENSFELSFQRCQFYGASHSGLPSVLLRGLPDVPGQVLSRVPYVYIVSFQSCMFVNGGVTYLQLAQLDNVAATDFSFINCLSEYLGTPLLAVSADPAVRIFRMELVTISNYEAWDAPPGASPSLPVVSFTGGRANHSLDGITILNSGNIAGKPAIQMNAGRLGGATLLDGHWYGGVDVVGKDSAASWVSRSSGGFTFSAHERMLTTRRESADLNGHSQHTFIGGYSGEATARWSLDADGVAQFGDGSEKKFDTRMDRPRVIEASWDPRPMARQAGAGRSGDSLNVSVPTAALGDLLQVTHEGLGASMVLLSAHVAEAGVVTVVALNAGETTVDLPNATVRLLLTKATAL
jgi:hypothetical protein